MASNPTGRQPGHGEQSGVNERSGAGEPGADRAAPRQQRYGPLALERHRKADGRALTIFSRAEPSPQAQAAGSSERDAAGGSERDAAGGREGARP